jgi:uncharacterized protein YgbK (DUF1537 family)
MLEWLVLADDRTGALEVAGEVATWLGPVTVTVGATPVDGTIAVVDLGSRHRAPADAGVRAARADAVAARRRLHKIDSTLRGNWAHELVAVQRASGDRVLVVPAFPGLGRSCRDGVVHIDGVPVGQDDARHSIASPRAAAHLASAGAGHVAELADVTALETWLAGGGAFAVGDASTDDDLAAIGEVWRRAADVRFAGTAGSIAAAVAAEAAATTRAIDPPIASLDGGVLVVCGSLHPVARAQVAAVRAAHRDAGRVTVLCSPEPDGPSVAAADAERVASELGAAAGELLASGRFEVVVVLGGDTAAAVLGDGPVVVGGTLAPGVPWSRRVDGSGPLVVTKAGGFGDRSTVVELLAAGRSAFGRSVSEVG